MLGIIASHEGMLVAMWVVMVAIGLEIVVYLATRLRRKADIGEMAEAVTRPVLFDIFPLIILSMLRAIDGTHILLLIWYYVAAVLIIIRALLRLSANLRR
ncbi:hypothetical protein [Alicyclobacillus ferrooxydans]|uniref:Uncharacterized protein n=1 Tax=Alicyclobacillus ferrooxydans TaxID=471514 RepID=A0A0N8PMX1_9BACL|nr:hypothetical protein [Alicyclobacillus ferrooxydans]KPV39909.1 hypothetical protein AN477_22105 [Alicyclobacillus ferrooxydans]